MSQRRPRGAATSAGLVAWGWYAVVEMAVLELPATGTAVRAPVLPGTGLAPRGTRGEAFWAAWWTESPVLEPWVPPDDMGLVDGHLAHAEAIGAADRAIRQAKGQRVYAVSVGPTFAARAFQAGVRRQSSGAIDWATAVPAAFRALGIGRTTSTVRIKAVYRKLISERRLHPDHGGDPAAFRELTAHLDVAEAWARAEARRRELTRLATKKRAKQEAADA